MVQNCVMQRDSWASTFPSKMQLLDCFFIQLKIHGTSLNFFILVQVLVQFPEEAPCLYRRPSKFRLKLVLQGTNAGPWPFYDTCFYTASIQNGRNLLVLSLQMIKYKEHYIHIPTLYVAYQIICFQIQLFFLWWFLQMCRQKGSKNSVCCSVFFSCNFEQETACAVKAGLHTC